MAEVVAHIRVTDAKTGDVQQVDLVEDDYVIFNGPKLELSVQHWPKSGTTQLTLKKDRSS